MMTEQTDTAWLNHYIAYLENTKEAEAGIVQAQAAAGEIPEPYRGRNPIRRYRETKAFDAAQRAAAKRLEMAEAKKQGLLDDFAGETMALIVEGLPPTSLARRKLDAIAERAGQIDAVEETRDLAYGILAEMGTVSERAGQARHAVAWDIQGTVGVAGHVEKAMAATTNGLMARIAQMVSVLEKRIGRGRLVEPELLGMTAEEAGAGEAFWRKALSVEAGSRNPQREAEMRVRAVGPYVWDATKDMGTELKKKWAAQAEDVETFFEQLSYEIERAPFAKTGTTLKEALTVLPREALLSTKALGPVVAEAGAKRPAVAQAAAQRIAPRMRYF